MIKDEKEYTVTQGLIGEFGKSIAATERDEARKTNDHDGWELIRSSLQSHLDKLKAEIAEYESLISHDRHSPIVLKLDDLDYLPQILIKARMAATKITSPYRLTFEIGWNSDDQFSFGDYSQDRDIKLYALARLVKHPVSQDFSVELSHKFITYHALHKRNQSQHYHPIDNILVAETNLDSHKTYDPTDRVIIHRDYLRDFLSALGMGLLISVTADRFRLMTAPLVGLNELRIGSAHIGNPELEPIFQLMGASTIPETPRAGWNFCVDAVANCLCSIAGILES